MHMQWESHVNTWCATSRWWWCMQWIMACDLLMMLQVGAMFDTIQRSNATTSDWAMLLLQLISHEVVDCQTNR